MTFVSFANPTSAADFGFSQYITGQPNSGYLAQMRPTSRTERERTERVTLARNGPMHRIALLSPLQYGAAPLTPVDGRER
jgi:hypothetical protein